jgi:hypothetical protein
VRTERTLARFTVCRGETFKYMSESEQQLNGNIEIHPRGERDVFFVPRKNVVGS